jgi:hypothetical protein
MHFRTLRNVLGFTFSSALVFTATTANAIPFTVFAYENSSAGAAGVSTLTLTAGQSVTVTAAATDLWSAGEIPRFSNADGLNGLLVATGSDESGYPAGTIIGAPFALFAQDGFTAAYGSLVGRIGSTYVQLGTNVSFIAPEAGVLSLYYWDSNISDNFGSILVDVSVTEVDPVAAVPEPTTLALMGAGLLLMGFAARRKRA